MATRREKIETMLVTEPKDVFLRYSLALELVKEGEEHRALAMLSELATEDPPYIPAFFRSAQILSEDGTSEDAGKVAEARDYLRRGIETARAQGDLHAAGEMSELLSDLGQLGE